MRKRKSILLVWLGVLLLLSAGYAQDLQQASMMVQWTPQSQFAGYYVAVEKGFYEAHGVDMQVLRGGPDRSPTRSLLAGEVDFATMFLSRGLDLRSRGYPVVNVAQVINQGTVMLVGRKSYGIEEIEDLNGSTISLWDGEFNIPFRAFFAIHNIEYTRVPQYYSVNLFLRGGVDACAAMHYNEYHMIYQAGVDFNELTPLMLRDHGVNIPEDGIYCLAPLQQANPGLCNAVAEASLEGWRYAREHPEEALDIIMEYVNAAHVPTNRAHMSWMLRIVLDAIFPDHSQTWTAGRLSREQFQDAVDLMMMLDLIHEAPGYEAFIGEEATDVP